MKLISSARLAAVAAIMISATVPNAMAGAVHNEFPFTVDDWNDCTGEPVTWDVVIKEVLLDKVSPSGQGLFMDQWLWEGTVEGWDSGYVWFTKGHSPYVETYSLDNTLTGGYILLENSVLKPLSEGAPRIKLDVKITMRYNAAGELVVDKSEYVYNCLGN